MDSLRQLDGWQVDHAAATVVRADGAVDGRHGDQDLVFRLASVTKLLTAYAVLVAVEEGAVEWAQPAGPPGSTLRHLAAHCSGLPFEGLQVAAAVGTRRIYSNSGFELLAEAVTDGSGIPFADYLTEAVLEPLGMTATRLAGSPAAGAESCCADLGRFAAELQRPRLVSAQTLTEATAVAFPGLTGVLPGFGLQRPNDWGLGFELRGQKDPHWTGKTGSPETFGHFGQAGTFLWVDPAAGAACVVLTDREFGPWAHQAWPTLSDAVLAELAG